MEILLLNSMDGRRINWLNILHLNMNRRRISRSGRRFNGGRCREPCGRLGILRLLERIVCSLPRLQQPRMLLFPETLDFESIPRVLDERRQGLFLGIGVCGFEARCLGLDIKPFRYNLLDKHVCSRRAGRCSRGTSTRRSTLIHR